MDSEVTHTLLSEDTVELPHGGPVDGPRFRERGCPGFASCLVQSVTLAGILLGVVLVTAVPSLVAAPALDPPRAHERRVSLHVEGGSAVELLGRLEAATKLAIVAPLLDDATVPPVKLSEVSVQEAVEAVASVLKLTGRVEQDSVVFSVPEAGPAPPRHQPRLDALLTLFGSLTNEQRRAQAHQYALPISQLTQEQQKQLLLGCSIPDREWAGIMRKGEVRIWGVFFQPAVVVNTASVSAETSRKDTLEIVLMGGAPSAGRVSEEAQSRIPFTIPPGIFVRDPRSGNLVPLPAMRKEHLR